MSRTQRGFTLTELMITVAIVVALGAYAVSNYNAQVTASRRTDAKTALLRLAAEQEKFYLQNNSYASLEDLGDPETDYGWYTLAVPRANATTFTLTATAIDTGPQGDDSFCAVFALTAAGQRTASDSKGNDTTDTCW
jgi:type IV pilus assembly protein PilE